jgi:gliding motility-associated protein GldM
MAGFKETPRQKMIGMMYLVLTALLALNVSKEILTAFLTVNESMEITTENFSKKVDDRFLEFQQQFKLNEEKVRPFFEKAQLAKNYSEDLINYIDSLKYYVIAETEGIPVDTAKITPLVEIRNKNDYDTPTRLLVGKEGSKKALGYQLEDKIIEYKSNMLNLVDENDRGLIQLGLKTDGEYFDADGVKQSWVRHNFYHTILAADVTIFNKLINEVLNAQYDLVNYHYSSITKSDFKFSEIAAKVIPSSRIVFQGEEYNADIIVAAVDETAEPTIDYVVGQKEWKNDYLNLSSIEHKEGDSGYVRLSLNTGSYKPDQYDFSGRIGIQKPNSQEIAYYPFSSSFYVLEPSANVAATKMNVFYRGVDNPVKISAAGVPASEVGYEIVGDGRIQKTSEGLMVNNLKQPRVNSVKVIVYRDKGRERKQLGEQEFRVKDLPPPEFFVTGMNDNNIVGKGGFLANPFIRSALPDYVNFDYKYKVTGFSMWVRKNGADFEMRSSSNRLTADMVEYIQTARKNSKLFFTDIEVQGPLKKFRAPTPLVVTLN